MAEPKVKEATSEVLQHPKASVARLVGNRFALAEHAGNRFRATPPYGVTFEQIQNPAYWAHIASRVKPGDIIDVLPEDMSFCAEMLVVSCNRLEVRVHTKHHSIIEAPKPEHMEDAADPQFDVKWGGPVAKFRVIRKEDKKVVQDQFPTAGDARAWLVDYLKALGH